MDILIIIRLQRKLELSPKAETAYSQLILNTSNAAVLEMGAIMDRNERIMEGRKLFQTADGLGAGL